MKSRNSTGSSFEIADRAAVHKDNEDIPISTQGRSGTARKKADSLAKAGGAVVALGGREGCMYRKLLTVHDPGAKGYQILLGKMISPDKAGWISA